MDSDAASLGLLDLGNNHTQDSVVEAGGNRLGIDMGGEIEAPGELANAALREPVLGLILRFLGGTRSSDAGFGAFLLDGRLVGLLRLAGLNGAGRGLALESWGGSLGVGSLNAPTDDHGLGVGELDGDITLVQAGKFSVKFVGFLSLADIELGLEVGEAGAGGAATLACLVGIKVFEETEEGAEALVAVEGSWEESHCA